MNQLQGTPEREVVHLYAELTTVLNEYVEETLEHDIILAEEDEEGHRLVFSCAPTIAENFPVGSVFNIDMAMERIS